MANWWVYYWHAGYLWNAKGTRLDRMTVEEARTLVSETDADLHGHRTGQRAVLIERSPERTTFLGIGKKES